jgi:hypothetical protein
LGQFAQESLRNGLGQVTAQIVDGSGSAGARAAGWTGFASGWTRFAGGWTRFAGVSFVARPKVSPRLASHIHDLLFARTSIAASNGLEKQSPHDSERRSTDQR